MLDVHVESYIPNLEDYQYTTKFETQTPFDSQVKAVLAKMAAAGIGRPATVADVGKAALFCPKLLGSSEHVFQNEDRQIPGSAGSVAIRLYTPKTALNLPILVFFHGGSFTAGSLNSQDSPLRSLENRCE